MNLIKILAYSILSMICLSSHASTIFFNIGGQITTVDPRITTVSIEDTWSADLYIDALTLDTSSSSSWSGTAWYDGVTGSYNIGELEIINIDLSSPYDQGTQYNRKVVSNNFPSAVGVNDSLQFLSLNTDLSTEQKIDGYKFRVIKAAIYDTVSALALNGNMLDESLYVDLENYDLTDFVITVFEGVGSGSFAAVRGNVTNYSATVVPIPSAVGLFVFGLVSLSSFYRKTITSQM